MTDTIEIRRDRLAYGAYFTDYSEAATCPACAVGQYAQQQPDLQHWIDAPHVSVGTHFHEELQERGVDTSDVVGFSDMLAAGALPPETRTRYEDRVFAAFAKGGITVTFTGKYRNE